MLKPRALTGSLVRLLSRSACDMPADVENALRRARDSEVDPSPARWALDEILENIVLARKMRTPICQDSGTLTFVFRVPAGTGSATIRTCAEQAVIEATQAGMLRQNTVDSITGRSSPTNEGDGVPVVHVYEWPEQYISAGLLMKGGGCENVAAQFSLPDNSIAAGRDLDGVYRCALEALVRAQGKGCAPGVLGLCIGGDRAMGYAFAKEQYFRNLDDSAADPDLAALERRVADAAAQLKIGPMGLGGKTTLLGVKACALSRLPASYFVTASYMCWALRRYVVELDSEQRIVRWIG